MSIPSLKIIVILGPTASGKSAVAIKLAKKFNGEIISADSRQIYRGMDIGTGKVTGALESVILSEQSEPKDLGQDSSTSLRFGQNDNELKVFVSEGIPHYAIDIVDPNEDFNITDFKKYTQAKIKEILERGKLPIICGGTGFWISAVVDDLDFPEVAPDPKLRAELDEKSVGELFEQLLAIDPERASSIDKHNKFRLIRALEICQALGKVPKPKSQNQKPSPYQFLQIGISVEKEILHKKIKKRLNERFAQGMIEEVEKLHSEGISWEKLEGFGLEYRKIAEFLQGKISKEEMMEKLYFDIIHYAKRQMTWFGKDERTFWLNDYKEIEKQVANYLH